MKRIMSFVLALVLVLSLVPVSALKAEASTGGKLIALTFDDGPSSKYTEQLLDGLAERGVKVTFFMLGENADSYTSIVKRAYEEGHEIACHSWDHPNLNELSTSEVKSQMSKTYTALSKACGDSTDYLVRPPYGNANSSVKAAISNPLIYWSVDTEDWKYRNAETVKNNIVNDAFDGAIVLCHDIHKTTVPGALEAIDILLDKGYEFVTVSELYRRRGEEMQDSVFHYKCKPTGVDYGPVAEPKITYSIPGNGKARITITCDMDAPIYYTLDGTYPNNEATKYTGPFDVPYGTTVKAVAAYKLNGDRSDTVTFVVPTSSSQRCATPTIRLDSNGKVVMSTTTPGAKIYYTLDNTEAGTDDILYSGAVAIPGGSYIRAIAYDGFHKNSKECVYYYSEDGKLYADMDPSKWYYDAIESLHLGGIINGVSEYCMDPDGVLTRAMVVTLLYRYSGDSLQEGWQVTNSFQDVKSDFYYSEAIEWAYRNGIVNGYSETAFGPDDGISRQQMCKMVASYLSYVGKPLDEGESCQNLFADYDDIAAWALSYVEAMVSAGLIQGDGTYMFPEAGATRAQFCVLLCRIMDYEANYVPPVEEEPEEPTDPEDPSEPEHAHEWKISNTDVSIDVGETFRLYIFCTGVGCDEVPEYSWSVSTEDVVSIDGIYITGLKAGWNTWVRTEVEGVTYQCIVRVRKEAAADEVTDPGPAVETEEPVTEPADTVFNLNYLSLN